MSTLGEFDLIAAYFTRPVRQAALGQDGVERLADAQARVEQRAVRVHEAHRVPRAYVDVHVKEPAKLRAIRSRAALVARRVRQRQDELGDFARADPLLQRRKIQILRTDAVDRRVDRRDVARAVRREVQRLPVGQLLAEQLERGVFVVEELDEDVFRTAEVPLSIVWGDKDPVLGRVINHLGRMRPDATIVRTQAGHFLQEEVQQRLVGAAKARMHARSPQVLLRATARGGTASWATNST